MSSFKKTALIVLAFYTLLLILARFPMIQILPYFSELTLLVGLCALPCFLFLISALFASKNDLSSKIKKENTCND